MPHVGIHRGLGVHISKVRSCTLDTWLPEQVAFMARTGNAAANAHFEARLPRRQALLLLPRAGGLHPAQGEPTLPGHVDQGGLVGALLPLCGAG